MFLRNVIAVDIVAVPLGIYAITIDICHYYLYHGYDHCHRFYIIYEHN